MNAEHRWSSQELFIPVTQGNTSTDARNAGTLNALNALTQELNTNALKKMENNFEHYEDKRLFGEMFRATGRTTKLVDELVQEFFEKPMGTKIPVLDHFPDRRADEYLLDRFMKRLESEHPGATCKIHREKHITIERTSPTYHEKVKEEYARRQEEKNKKKET